MCTQDLVNTDLFSFRWHAGKSGCGQYTHRRIERECAWFGSWCPSDMRTSTCFLGRLMCNVICCILSLHAVLGSTWERRSPSCSVLQSVTLLVDSHSCCCSCILHCHRCDSKALMTSQRPTRSLVIGKAFHYVDFVAMLVHGPLSLCFTNAMALLSPFLVSVQCSGKRFYV